MTPATAPDRAQPNRDAPALLASAKASRLLVPVTHHYVSPPHPPGARARHESAAAAGGYAPAGRAPDHTRRTRRLRTRSADQSSIVARSSAATGVPATSAGLERLRRPRRPGGPAHDDPGRSRGPGSGAPATSCGCMSIHPSIHARRCAGNTPTRGTRWMRGAADPLRLPGRWHRHHEAQPMYETAPTPAAVDAIRAHRARAQPPRCRSASRRRRRRQHPAGGRVVDLPESGFSGARFVRTDPACAGWISAAGAPTSGHPERNAWLMLAHPERATTLLNGVSDPAARAMLLEDWDRGHVGQREAAAAHRRRAQATRRAGRPGVDARKDAAGGSLWRRYGRGRGSTRPPVPSMGSGAPGRPHTPD